MNNPWVLSVEECHQNEKQFLLFQPVNGLISGDQVCPFLLKSNLPPNILAQIWQLGDLNKDGKLDRLEFFIVMHLVQNCLKGIPLPPVLPESLKHLPIIDPISLYSAQQQPIVIPQISTNQSSLYGATLPANFGGTNNQLYSSYNASFSTTPSFIMGTKELGDWSIPQHLKLRFSQQFNQIDRNRIGLLNGAQLRGILGESQLPTNVLAQIWNMSDVNNDGCLNVEEFCIAMHIIEKVKSGFALPTTLPVELKSFCNRSKTASPFVIDPTQPPPQKNAPLKTFEDKRRDNLDRGQIELERRRQILREEEERRRAEIERKEREEQDRRERERQELEKKREAEREAERLRELEREREREAEEKRIKLERDEARKRLEQERIKELEKIRIRDLETQYQNELEKTTQFQQRYKTMTFQLQAMEEHSQQLNTDITKSHSEIVAITSEIEKMREIRDEKIARINEIQIKSQETAIQCERVSHENLQMQTEIQKTFSKKQNIENLTNQISELNNSINLTENELKNAKERLINHENIFSNKSVEFENSKEKLQKVLEIYNKLVDKFFYIKEEAQKRINAEKKKTIEQELSTTEDPSRFYSLPPADKTTNIKGFDSDFTPNFSTAFPNSQSFDNGSVGIVSSSSVSGLSVKNSNEKLNNNNNFLLNDQLSNVKEKKTVKYRALFEFIARSDDELSLQPNDIIFVFEDHASEPGWLAGQIKDKVGWFPAAFAEKIQDQTVIINDSIKKTIPTTSSISTSPVIVEPLKSIKEELKNGKEFHADFKSAFSDDKDEKIEKKIAELSITPIKNGFSNNKPLTVSNSILYDALPNLSNDNLIISNIKNDENVIAIGTALYQWKSRNETEISFNRNDIIEVLEQGEMRWRGRLKKNPNIKGWFPKSYIKLHSDNASETYLNKQLSQKKSIEDLNSPTIAYEIDKTLNLQNKLLNKTEEEKLNGNWYVAMYQFDAVEPTDLSLKPGDMIYVFESNDEWWKGTCNKKTGIFPANYVQKVQSQNLIGGQKIGRAMAAYEATAPNQISLKIGDLVRIHNTSPGGWWEGEVERNGIKKTGWFPGNYIQVLSDGNAIFDETKKENTVYKLAIAIFDYTPQHLDELFFKTGDIIEVFDQTDSQWWKGRKHGTDSAPLLFPYNYVQLK